MDLNNQFWNGYLILLNSWNKSRIDLNQSCTIIPVMELEILHVQQMTDQISIY